MTLLVIVAEFKPDNCPRIRLFDTTKLFPVFLIDIPFPKKHERNLTGPLTVLESEIVTPKIRHLSKVTSAILVINF